MIRREKIILYIISFIILIISYDLISNTFFDNSIQPIQKKEQQSIAEKRKIIAKETEPISLSINSWGKDIFYNRSYKYKSWFNLTGITRFEDVNKAIINGNILHEKDKIKGFTIKRIANNYVILKKNKHTVTLKIKE